LSFFDRLAQGPGNLQANDFEDWNQMVGAAPPERFGRATYDAIRQVDPQDYYNHTQPGVGGTDPFGGLVPQERTGLAQSILGELLRRGLGQQEISRGAGLGTLDPERMSPQDLASLAQWTQRSQPKAFGRVAAQYQDQPDTLSSLLGNEALMSTLASLGMKLAADQFAKRR
jgi:hypothetical protein